jgi:hypothetical protein
MRQKEGEIVANDIPLRVDPDLFADNADPAPTPKFILVVGVFAQADPSSHLRILVQVMPLTQQL